MPSIIWCLCNAGVQVFSTQCQDEGNFKNFLGLQSNLTLSSPDQWRLDLGFIFWGMYVAIGRLGKVQLCSWEWVHTLVRFNILESPSQQMKTYVEMPPSSTSARLVLAASLGPKKTSVERVGSGRFGACANVSPCFSRCYWWLLPSRGFPALLHPPWQQRVVGQCPLQCGPRRMEQRRLKKFERQLRL